MCIVSLTFVTVLQVRADAEKLAEATKACEQAEQYVVRLAQKKYIVAHLFSAIAMLRSSEGPKVGMHAVRC
jgi:hypothetical protein